MIGSLPSGTLGPGRGHHHSGPDPVTTWRWSAGTWSTCFAHDLKVSVVGAAGPPPAPG